MEYVLVMKGLKNSIRMNPYLRGLLVVSNWLFQGIIHADRTEKVYKISFSIVASVVFYLFYKNFLNISSSFAILIGLFSGHTLNWVVNSNFYNIIIHRLLLSKLDKQKAFGYLDSLSSRLKGNPSILYATTHGSICRGDLKPSSDIDVALVRKKGFINAVRSIFFVTIEKKIADRIGIPLEIYLIDQPASAIQRFKNELNPVVIYDSDNLTDKYYNETLSIADARKLNGL